MAQVPVIKSWSEAKPYLKNLVRTVEADVGPLLKTPGSAPFAVSREVLSYIDHLGHLYTGESAVGRRSRKYLAEVLSKVDQNYGQRAAEIYEMYRCGSAHEFEPKLLRNKKGQSLGWLCYRGERQAQILIDGQQVVVTHLEPVPSTTGALFWLPVSTVCLIDDLVASIEQFAHAGPASDRVAAWNRAAQDLSKPVSFEFTIP